MTATHSDQRRRLRESMAIIAIRGGRGTAPGTAYRIYESALAAAVLLAIVIRPLAVGLATSEVAAVLDRAATVETTALILLVATVMVLALGRILGPVVPSAPYLALVVSSPLSRSVTLHGHFARARLALVALSTLSAVTLLGGDFLRGAADPLGAGVFLLAVLLGSWQVTTLWLIGQLNGPVRRMSLLLLTAILAIALGAQIVPGAREVVSWLGPWGWIAHTRLAVTEGVGGASLISLALLALGLFGSTQNARLLDRLSYEDLAMGAVRWGTISSLMVAGETRAATNRIKALPRIGRHWRIRFPGQPLIAIVLRDAVGLCRFPLRTSLWALAALAGGALLSGLFTEAPKSPLLSMTAAIVIYFALGGWAEGLRHHASSVGASSPFGLSPGRQALAHLVVPALGTGTLVLVGATVPTVFDPSLDAAAALPWTAALTGFLLVMQAFSALAGMLPITLLTPIPTPMGDMSIMVIALWLADAVVITLLVGGGLTMLASTASPVGALLPLAAASVLMACWAGIRYRKLYHHNG